MTVPTSDNREQYEGNDSATDFDYGFKIFSADDLVVILTDSNGNESTLVRGSDYSVDGVGSSAGGSVTYPLSGDPLATGETLIILREIPVTQETDLRNQGAYYPETLEDEFDRSRMIDQQLQEQSNRTLKKSKGGDNFDAGGSRIINVGDAVNSNDAASRSFMEEYFKQLESGELGNTSLVDTGSGASQNLQNALNARVIYANTIADLQALPAPSGQVIHLTEQERSGDFIIKTGTPPVDPQKGVYIALDNGNYAERIEKTGLNTGHFGASYVGDESSIAQAMVDVVNELRVPKGRVLTAKNIALKNDTVVDIQGEFKLPDGCGDFDRGIYGYDIANLDISISEFNGNAENQTGDIGTHLVYLIGISNSALKIKKAKDHYYGVGGFLLSNDNGNRTASSGAIYINLSKHVDVSIDYMDKWGREGVYLRECSDCNVKCGHLQSSAVAEYSGLQVSGTRNKVSRVSVDNAAGSSVGFDSTYGSLENVLSTNNRTSAGVNFGHPNYPASHSTASNIIVDRSWGRGLQVSAGTENLKMSNFSLTNSGDFGMGVSDNSKEAQISNGRIAFSAKQSLFVSQTTVLGSSVNTSDNDAFFLEVDSASGAFVDGESITTPNGSGAIRTSLINLVETKQKIFLSSYTPTISVGETITGGTSGATARVVAVSTPGGVLLQNGGRFSEGAETYLGSVGNQIRFEDGTAIYYGTIPVTVTAGGTLFIHTDTYQANVIWKENPVAGCSIASYSDTSNFVISYLTMSAQDDGFEIRIKSDVAQTYGISFSMHGFWK